MEYKNIINLLDTTPNQLSKFRTKILVQINDDPYGMHNTDSQIKFKISMLKSSLSNYSEANTLAKGTIPTGKCWSPEHHGDILLQRPPRCHLKIPGIFRSDVLGTS